MVVQEELYFHSIGLSRVPVNKRASVENGVYAQHRVQLYYSASQHIPHNTLKARRPSTQGARGETRT